MKAVILAGGYGTRIGEETLFKPKPMIEIGGKPILWHIMKIYSFHGINNFVICCGYKGYLIKEFFSNYLLHHSDVTFRGDDAKVEFHQREVEPWTVSLVDTGEKTMTGGRLKRVESHLQGQDFCFTYGDSVSDLNIKELISFHQSQNTLATVTAVPPPPRFGALNISGNKVISFKEKPVKESRRINGGFFVLSSKVLDYIEDDQTSWEHYPMERLATEGNLSAYRYDGFWHPMDTRRDKQYLEDLWKTGQAPWKVW